MRISDWSSDVCSSDLIGMMRMLPHMTVINPCDYNQTKAATLAVAEHVGPVYLRFGRPSVPIFTPAGQKFEFGKALLISEARRVGKECSSTCRSRCSP